ncbi:MAG: hydantoinase/oxoprolinase family protein [SAR202 cluster bacterium]|jgi:N-methylhydantoinase A/oxoprolinase/acetone carboxylase beta subunit|nr:hydantoinase/oxoprolinase family protein [SAR202 cluster bacterium]MDP6512294.1 hydantoinase/oxoprolinase family protein [SAR202 cluster bacterium]MDP6714103.1 hydantoinase/oxoprolinase family protein [SAR202 cluster bacterium]
MTEPTHSLSIDIGGTFTDFTLLNIESGELSIHKVLTDSENPTRAFMRGTTEILQAAGIEPAALQVVVHSTTLATNAIIERKGAKIALLTTEGFRDVLELRREQIYDMHDLHARYPDPIVPRSLRVEVSERIDRDGRVFQSPDANQSTTTVDDLLKQGVEAVAISLLHAYKNPENEQALKDQISSSHPDLPLSLSSEVAPVINEYERTSTTVADTYIKPSVSRYIQGVEQELGQSGYEGRLLVMHSAGGVMDASAAMERPVRMLESGPAAGALAAGFYSDLLGEPDLISLDMGGTTAKTCVIEDGKPAQSNSIEVARVHRFKVGSGLPILIPVLDLIEIGSGGGSIASLDNLGLLRVGPQSAGASPGPACYGQGGTQPTVTDANLMLGYLNPDYFLGGRMTLDIDAATSAMTALGSDMGMEPIEAAWGIYNVVTESMAAAARIHIIGRNKDPRNYAIVAFGGAGPAHACEVARILGATRVVVPLGAGVTSALGCLAAPLSFESVRSLPGLLDTSDWESVNNLFSEMESWGRDMLSNSGIPADQVTLTRTADMRLVGQIHEINVPIPDDALAKSSVDGIESDFHQIYQQLYSRRNLSIPIEVQNWRLLVSGPQPVLNLQEQSADENADVESALSGSRPAYFPNADGFVDCPVYDRYKLTAGTQIPGPAIIEEEESTTIIRPGDSASVDRWLNLLIQVEV